MKTAEELTPEDLRREYQNELDEQRQFAIDYETNRRKYGMSLSPQQVYLLTYARRYGDGKRPSPYNIRSVDKYAVDEYGRNSRGVNTEKATVGSDFRDVPTDRVRETPSSEYYAEARGLDKPSAFSHHFGNYVAKGLPSIVHVPALFAGGVYQGVKNKLAGRPWGSPISNTFTLYNRYSDQPSRIDMRAPASSTMADRKDEEEAAEKYAYLASTLGVNAPLEILQWNTAMSAIGKGINGFKLGGLAAKRGAGAVSRYNRLQKLKRIKEAAKLRELQKLGKPIPKPPLATRLTRTGMSVLPVVLNEVEPYKDTQKRIEGEHLSSYLPFSSRIRPTDFANPVTGQKTLLSDNTNPYLSYQGAVNNFPHVMFPDNPQERSRLKENTRIAHERNRLKTNLDKYREEYGRLAQQTAQDRNDRRLIDTGRASEVLRDDPMTVDRAIVSNLPEFYGVVPDKKTIADNEKRVAHLKKMIPEYRRRLDYLSKGNSTMDNYNKTDFSK